MPIHLASRFAFDLAQPASVLLQFEAADMPGQQLVETACDIKPVNELTRVAAQDNIGERIWLHAENRVEVRYEASVAVDRDLPALENLHQLSPHRLPGDAVKFLLSSRYCFSNQFLAFVEEEFGGTEGGARIAAIRDWLNTHIAYSPGVSGPQTTAVDTFHARAGVCRDFAHMLVTLARASSIPARYVSCYAPGVTPQDFHAVAQVYLANPQGTGGDWHLVDATGMADLEHAAIIGVGRDAADVAFVTSFAPMQFEYVKVDVARG